MNVLISNGVEIQVVSQFKEDYSSIETNSYIFVYTITIHNRNDFPIQLLSRCWSIFDSINETNIVSGAGVVGESPVIKPNESYHYSSFCELKSDIGKMHGHYLFTNLTTTEFFKVQIPSFQLIHPSRLN